MVARVSVWNDFGFRESPYATDHLPATEEGARLMVGRDVELRQLRMLLRSSNRHPTIEGDNGVGKTSLVNVAGYHAVQEFLDGGTGQLMIPLERPFQLSPTGTVQGFRREVLFEVARAFIKHEQLLKRAGLETPDVGDVNKWLNAPIFTGGGGGASFAGFGGQGIRTEAPNTSAGFSEAGFDAAVDRWLRDCFRSRQAGAFVCVIDNLELLETSQTARALLEGMRDSVLSQAGLRWVLCGARGLVRTGASSPRLEGTLAEPMILKPIPDAIVPEVVARRIEVFAMVPDAYAPVEPRGFHHIYEILHANLRNSLRFCEDFAFWLQAQDKQPESSDERFELLEIWLSETADRYEEDTTSVGKRAWLVFGDLVELGGSCSPGDHEQFGYDTPMALRPQIKSLEDAQLVQSSTDDKDKRRKTIVVTPRGWLVQYKRSGYERPESN
jgi:hypothetical protein